MALLGVLAGFVLAQSAEAANTQARLLLSHEVAQAGMTVTAGIELRMAPRWHTYWRNGGDSGKPTEVLWKLPPGVQAGEIRWPVPEKLVAQDQTTYVYSKVVVLLVPLILAPDLKPQALNLSASLSWLECDELCVPGKAEVRGTLRVGQGNQPSSDAPLIKAAEARLPRTEPKLALQAWWAGPPSADSRRLVLEWSPLDASAKADFFPYAGTNIDVLGPTQAINAPPGKLRIEKEVKKYEGDWPSRIAGLVVEKPNTEASIGYAADAPILAAAPGTVAAGSATPGGRLLAMLGLAFLGGLILNIMPCVLPVISLKILSLTQQSHGSPSEVRRLGLLYVVGVLVSFLALAGLVIGLQQASRAASWGIQFQNQQFLVGMTILMVLVALNLFGIFEVGAGSTLNQAVGELAARSGGTGAFFNGVLATVLATPCTAPYLAPALGFAFAQPPAIIAVMFLAIGLGMALPYLLLSLQPAWLRFLPRPGAWMEKFKIIMGFPMLATALWLFLLAANQLGKSNTFWFGLFLVVLALSAWIYGEFVQRGRHRRNLAAAVAFILTLGFGAYALQHPREQIQWRPWNPQAVAQARQEGRPVLVDFTADWCATCQLNKKTSLEVQSVRARLKDINAVTLLGDFTREDPAIAGELKRFERAGVPLVLVYPRDATQPPIVLPEVLTPGRVLEALDKAAD